MIQNLRSYLARDGLGPTLMRALAGSAGIRIGGMFFGFLVGIQLARSLGAEGYGIYGIAMSVISLITIPTEFGLPQLVTREVAAAQVGNDERRIAGVLHWANRTVILLSMSMAGAGFVGWVLFKEKFSDGVAIVLLAGLPLVPLVALDNLRGAALRGLQHIVRGQIPSVLLRPALFSLLLLLASIFSPSGLNPAVAMAMQALAAAMTLIVATYMLKAFLPRIEHEDISVKDKHAWLRSALPMALTEGMRILHSNVSIFLLGAVATSAVVGVFRVASSMGLLMTMPITLLHIVAAPIFSRLYAAGDHKRLQKMLSCIAGAMVLGVTVLIIPFILFGPQLMGKVFGAEFSASNAPMLIISIGTVIGSAFGAGVILLNMTGYERRVTRAFGLSLALLGVLSFPFIQLWGAMGAALANSISFVFWSVLMWVDARRLLQLDTSVFELVKGIFSLNVDGANS